MDENNASTALDNTADDIQEARDDNGGDDARALQEMIVLNSRGLAKETRGASSLCLRPMNPSNQHGKASGRTLSLGGSQIRARKGRDFISLQRYLTLAPNCCLSVTTNTSPHPGKTQGEVNDEEAQVPKTNVLDDLLGCSSTSMDVDPSSVNGETELNVNMQVKQVVNDTDPLMLWKQHQ